MEGVTAASPFLAEPGQPLAECEFEALNRALTALAVAPTLKSVVQAIVDNAVLLSGAAGAELRLCPDDAPGAPRFNARNSRRGDLDSAPEYDGALTATTFPLAVDGRELGVLSVLMPHGTAPLVRPSWRVLVAQAGLAVERMRRFEQLQHAKREWELIFDGMVDGVYICVDGVILRANRTLAAMLGLHITDIVGEQREKLLARLPEYHVIRPWSRVEHGADDLDLQTTEFRFGTPERIFVETGFALRFDGPAHGIVTNGHAYQEAQLERSEVLARRVCIMREITEQRHLQEQLLQSEKLAALGELVSGVAHELNNPLTTVVGYAQLLEEEAGIAPNVQRRIGMIHQESLRASRIVQNLLAFARRTEPQKAQVDINEVINSLIRMRAYQLQADNVQVRTDFADRLLPVWGDPFQLQQVFLNIINNAAQAVQTWRGGGDIHVTTQLVPDFANGEAGVRVTITDNGPGIPPDHLRRVFDPFFTTKAAGQGTGLGMSISLGIISNHNGRIWAESRLGHGARFIVELPAAAHDQDDVPEPVIEPASPTPLNPQSHILVVDDEELVVTLITEILALDGHHITPAFNGAEALTLLEQQDFDLIVSDVRMPAVGGPTFFDILQTTRPDLLPRVMFVTGDTVSRSTQAFLQKAGRPVLSKPFDPERLRALVAENLPRLAS